MDDLMTQMFTDASASAGHVPGTITRHIIRFQAGDQTALDDLLRVMLPLITRVVNQRLARRNAARHAEDLIDDIWVAIYLMLTKQRCSQLNDRENLLKLIHTIARRGDKSLIDRERRQPVSGEAIFPFLESELRPDDMAAYHRAMDKVFRELEKARQLNKIDDIDLKLLDLRLTTTLTSKEIADRVGRSTRQVQNRLNALRQRIQRILELDPEP